MPTSVKAVFVSTPAHVVTWSEDTCVTAFQDGPAWTVTSVRMKGLKKLRIKKNLEKGKKMKETRGEIVLWQAVKSEDPLNVSASAAQSFCYRIGLLHQTVLTRFNREKR